ncbi:hypothetical protein WCLP8_1330001 [uncultured Gammaproteobacteria bacterium]
MAEAQVRQAITSDFKTLAEEITKQKNDVEQTTALSFDADNVLPVGGKAKVTYILGYQTQKLIQVNLTWSLGSGLLVEKLPSHTGQLQKQLDFTQLQFIN